MNLDPTLFSTPMYETANETVLFCKDFLQEKGYAQFAKRLGGFTPVSNNNVAIIVCGILEEMQPRVTGEAAEYVAIALSTVKRALGDLETRLSAVA